MAERDASCQRQRASRAWRDSSAGSYTTKSAGFINEYLRISGIIEIIILYSHIQIILLIIILPTILINSQQAL